MLVSDNLLNQIQNSYQIYQEERKKNKGELLAKNRKKIRILIDTLNEQLIEKFFKEKPRNALTGLLILNNRLDEILDLHERALLLSLKAVLEDYDILNDKSYIDHKPKLEPLFKNQIKTLYMNIALHTSLTKNSTASKLREILNASK